MNSFELYSRTSEGEFRVIADLWACGQCGRLYNQREVADGCCICHFCERPIEENRRQVILEAGEHRTSHSHCWEHHLRSQKIRRLNRAEEVEYEDGALYVEEWDRYFEDLDTFLDHCEDLEYDADPDADDGGVDFPMWVYPAREHRFRVRTSIIEDLLADTLGDVEGIEYQEFQGMDALKQALETFNDSNTWMGWLEPVYDKKYRVSKLLPVRERTNS